MILLNNQHYRRFTPEQMDDKAWTLEKCHESYVTNYKMVFPHDAPLAGRNLKQDPFYEVRNF